MGENTKTTISNSESSMKSVNMKTSSSRADLRTYIKALGLVGSTLDLYSQTLVLLSDRKIGSNRRLIHQLNLKTTGLLQRTTRKSFKGQILEIMKITREE